MIAPEQRKRYEILLRHARGMIGVLEELLAADSGHQSPAVNKSGTHDASRRNTEETSCTQRATPAR